MPDGKRARSPAVGSYPVAIVDDCRRVTGKPEVETDGRGGATMILPGETEAGSAGTQPC